MQAALKNSLCVVSPALAFAANKDAQDGELPRLIKFLNWGENIGRTTGARILVNDDSLAVLAANQERFAHESIELDYDHQSVKAHPNYKADPRHSAAHGSVEIVKGEGVFLRVASYTPNGREHALSYQDVSGVVHTDKKTGALLLVRSVALTQNGDVSGMEFAHHIAALSGRLDDLKISPEESQTKKVKPTKTMDTDETTNPHRDILIKLLGLAPGEGEEDVSEESITAAVETAGVKFALTALPNIPEVKKPEDKTEMAILSARMDKMEAGQGASERSALVAAATAQGKKIPLTNEQINATPIATLTSIIGNLEAGQVKTKSTVTDKENPTDAIALSADEKTVADSLGLSSEEFRAGQA